MIKVIQNFRALVAGGGRAHFARELRTFKSCVWAVLAVAAIMVVGKAEAQITNIVFQDDFEDGIIDTNKYQLDSPFFEGGKGTFNSVESGGVLQLTGEVTTRWWAGSTLRLVPVFNASPEQSVSISVDRVAEAGVGSASRSALWILDSTGTKFVLFADVRGEGGWHYNRKIGEGGDSPTGSGPDIPAFNGGDFDDGALHRMKAVANGRTVRLYLDDKFGVEVKFPYTNLVFHLGTYARNTADTADTTFDNLRVEKIGNATFSLSSLTLPSGQSSSGVSVRIPPGANATQPVQIRVVSSFPTIAGVVGATNGILTLIFPAGATNVQTIDIKSFGPTGGSVLSLQSDIGISGGNTLVLTVVTGPGVRLTEDFSGATLDTNKFVITDQGFEVGTGLFEVNQAGGRLEIKGTVAEQFWAGNSIKTVQSFTATKDLPLQVEIDRVSINRTSEFEVEGTAARTGVFLTTADRSKFFFLSQNLGESGWAVNLNPGNPTGSGTPITAFASKDDTNNHRIKLLADGTGVEVYLDGVFGGKFDFDVSSGVFVEIGAYARAIDDTVVGQFDNLNIENTFPCISVTPSDLSLIGGQPGLNVRVTIPRLLNSSKAVTVNVTSRDPAVAVAIGAVGATRTLTFGIGTTNAQTIVVSGVALGTTTLDLTTAESVCISQGISVTVTAPPIILLSDDFSGLEINTNNWSIEDTSLTPDATLTPESETVIVNGRVVMTATNESGAWPGLTLDGVRAFEAGPSTPVIFEIDRVKMEFVLVTGTGAKQRTGITIIDSTGTNYVFFGEYGTHDGAPGGWQYNRVIGQAGDTPLPAGGVSIPVFNAAVFNDQGNHRIKAIVNGSTIKFYLDDIFGAEVPFPVTEGIHFGFGTFVGALEDVAIGTFDNALVLGPGTGPGPGTLTAARQADGSVTLTWTGMGVLQHSDSVGTGANWTDVNPAPTGATFTVTKGSLGSQKFYRLRN